MKRSTLFAILFFSILLHALSPVKAAAVQVEAVLGEPFGVCRIVLPLSPAEQELVASADKYSRSLNIYHAPIFEITFETSVYESNKRALYPTWNIFDKTGASSETLLFLFQGQDELDVLLSRTGFEALQEKVKINPIENEELHETLIGEWWDAYLNKIRALKSLDLHDPSVELGVASMMSRRLELPFKKLEKILRMSHHNEFNEVFGLLLGTESIRLAMQANTMLEIKDKSEEADEDLPEAVLPPTMPVPYFDDSEVNIEPIAMRVPEKCFYLRFGSFPAFLEARDFTDRWGTIFRSIASSRSVNYGISKRIESQLALKETVLSRYFGSSVIEDVAVIGTDTFLREGAAIGLLFQAKQNDLLKNQLNSIRNGVIKENPRVIETTETIDGHTVSLLSSPGNEVRSFYVQNGDYHLVTTSRWMVKAFLATSKAPDQSLGSLKEFNYARSLVNPSEKGIFIYLSDPFFSNLVGPAYRVEMTRRAESVSEMQMLSLARLAAMQEGERLPSIVSLIENGFLPRGFGMRHDKSEPILEEDGTVIDNKRGALGSFLPIPDMTIDKITSSEEEAYEAFAEAYSRMWTYMDPVFGLLSNESTSTGERLELKLNISPYVRSRYDELDRSLGKPSSYRIATISGDLVSIEAHLKKGFMFPYVFFSHIFGGLRDMDIPWSIKNGAIVYDDQWNLKVLRSYVGITVPFGFNVKRPLSIFGIREKINPDAKGYAKLNISLLDELDSVWSRHFGSYLIIGTGRSLLEAVTPNIRAEKAENPSQISLFIGDLSESRLGNYLRAEAYVRDRRISAGNALLLQVYQQQLQPDDLFGAIKAVQNQSLTCPLGGTFVPADKEQPGRWKSTAWTEETLYQTNKLPDTYRQTIIDELKSMRLELSIDPDTLKTRLEIQIKK